VTYATKIRAQTRKCWDILRQKSECVSACSFVCPFVCASTLDSMVNVVYYAKQADDE
jgi:hypothetical protein